MSSQARYLSGSIKKYLMSLSFPAMLTIFLGLSFIAVDTYFLARYSSHALIAISFIFPVVALFQMIGNGLGIAASSIVSRFIGANDNDVVSNYIVAFILLSFIISIIIVPIGLLSAKTVFSLLGASEIILPLIQSFMSIWFVGFVFLLLGFIGSNILRAHGKPLLSAKIQITSSLINLVLSPFFIFIMDWGIGGSALAGVVARVITVAFMYYVIISNYIPDFRQSLINVLIQFKQYMIAIFKIAIPTGLTNAIGPLSSLFLVHMLARFGEATVAGFGIASRIELIAVVPLLALSGSIGPIIGQNIGAKQYDRSRETLVMSYQWSVIWSGMVAISLFFLGHAFALFFSHNITIVHVATIYLMILPCSYASWGFVMMTNANFNSMGQPLRSTCVSIIRLGVLFVPLCYWLGHFYGYIGIFIAFALANMLASLFAYILERSVRLGQKHQSLLMKIN